MSATHKIRDLLGKPVVSVLTGNVLATLEDVLVAPNLRQVAAAIGCRSSVSGFQTRALPSQEILVWGRDVILTDRSDLGDRPGGADEQLLQWPGFFGRLKECKVISTGGTLIGILYDMVITDRGQIVGYDLSEVIVGGPIAYSRQVPAQACRLLRADALVVDASRIE